MLLVGRRERALVHWLQSEQWASVLKAAVPWCVPRCAVAGRSVIQRLSLPGLSGAEAAGEGLARATSGRALAAVLLGLRTPKAKRGKVARPAPLHSSPRKEGEARTTAASEGEGKTGCWAALTPGGACAVPAEILAPHAWAPSTKNCPSARGRRSQTSVEGCEAKTRAPGLPARPSHFVHPLCPVPGAPSLWGCHHLYPPLAPACTS